MILTCIGSGILRAAKVGKLPVLLATEKKEDFFEICLLGQKKSSKLAFVFDACPHDPAGVLLS
jgi:hypothetical protein